MIIAFDEKWQALDKTEQFSLQQAEKLLPKSSNCLYISFPWATLFQFWTDKQSDSTYLGSRLLKLKRTIRPSYTKRVTVVQDIRLLEYLHQLADFGITDIFWPHFSSNDQKIG
jgi:hypothetical protein